MRTELQAPVVKRPLSKRPKIGFQDQSLNAGQKDCRMLQGEHSAILSTFIKLPSVIKIFVLSIFEWSFHIVAIRLRGKVVHVLLHLSERWPCYIWLIGKMKLA